MSKSERIIPEVIEIEVYPNKQGTVTIKQENQYIVVRPEDVALLCSFLAGARDDTQTEP